MWGIKSGQCVRICQADAGLRGLAIAAGKIFGAGNNAMLYIWDQSTTSMDPLASDRLARGGLTMVTVEGHIVLASSADKSVRMWEKVSVSQGSGSKGVDAHDDAATTSHANGGAAALSFLGDAMHEEEEEDTGVGVGGRGVEEEAGDVQDRGFESGDRDGLVVTDHKDKVHACCADAENGMLYSASSDCSICCQPIQRKVAVESRLTEQFLLKEHTDRVLAITLTGPSDGKVLLTASADKTIKKWALKSDGSPKKWGGGGGGQGGMGERGHLFRTHRLGVVFGSIRGTHSSKKERKRAL